MRTFASVGDNAEPGLQKPEPAGSGRVSMGKRGDSKISEQSVKGAAGNRELPSRDGPMGCSNWRGTEAASERCCGERTEGGGEESTEGRCREATWVDSDWT